MKFILGMVARNESFMLSKVLPLLMPFFDHAVVGYSASTDNTREILDKAGAIVTEFDINSDWGKARNMVIEAAEHIGGTHLLMLDADEAMLKTDLNMLRLEFQSVGPVAMGFLYPRYEFVDDFEHHDQSFYPDYQARGFPLNSGFYYDGKVHEQLCRDGRVCSQQNGGYLKSKRHIFHYGKSKPPNEVALKYLNYHRMQNGLERIFELPADHSLPVTWAQGPKVKFEGPKPL